MAVRPLLANDAVDPGELDDDPGMEVEKMMKELGDGSGEGPGEGEDHENIRRQEGTEAASEAPGIHRSSLQPPVHRWVSDRLPPDRDKL